MPINALTSLGAAAFALSGLLNILADFMPDAGTRLMNFAGVCLGVLGLQAVYLHTHRKTGAAALAGFLLATFGFLGIAGFLFTDAFVFPLLDPGTVETLTAGTTGLAILAAVILYVLGVLLFSATLFRASVLPKPALVLWAAGTLPTVAAIALPALVMTLAEIIASVGVVWIALAILRDRRAEGLSP
jgi:hypothetical protein